MIENTDFIESHFDDHATVKSQMDSAGLQCKLRFSLVLDLISRILDRLYHNIYLRTLH